VGAGEWKKKVTVLGRESMVWCPALVNFTVRVEKRWAKWEGKTDEMTGPKKRGEKKGNNTKNFQKKVKTGSPKKVLER